MEMPMSEAQMVGLAAVAERLRACAAEQHRAAGELWRLPDEVRASMLAWAAVAVTAAEWLEDVLRRAEWAASDDYASYCPWCEGRDDHGHAADCPAFPGGPPRYTPSSEPVDAGRLMAEELARLGQLLSGDTPLLSYRKSGQAVIDATVARLDQRRRDDIGE